MEETLLRAAPGRCDRAVVYEAWPNSRRASQCDVREQRRALRTLMSASETQSSSLSLSWRSRRASLAEPLHELRADGHRSTPTRPDFALGERVVEPAARVGHELLCVCLPISRVRLMSRSGFYFYESTFQATAAQASSSLMTLACITLILPAACGSPCNQFAESESLQQTTRHRQMTIPPSAPSSATTLRTQATPLFGAS